MLRSKGPNRGLRIFENCLLRDHPFWSKIGRKKFKTIDQILTMAESYIVLEEELDTRFDNPASVETYTSRPVGKESR